MPLVTIPIPPALGPYIREDRLRQHLDNNGVTTYQGAIVRGDGNIVVDLSDLSQESLVSSLVASYVDFPTAREVIEQQIMRDAKVTLAAIKAKGPANWTAQDKVLLAIAISVRDLRDAAQ